MTTTIGWVSDYNKYGGGETTEKEFIDRCPRNIKLIKMFGGKNIDTTCDFYIINNFRALAEIQLDYFIEKKKYIMAFRDVIDTRHDSLIRRMVKNACANIFLSPLHRKEFFKKFNIKECSHARIIAPYFNCNKYDRSSEKVLDICWAGNIQHHKGIEECLLWARDNCRMVMFYGKGDSQLIDQINYSKYAVYKGYHEDISPILALYKYFIHLPDKIEAFGRTCMEAHLSGCKIIRNGKIGMFSWDTFDDIEDTIERIQKQPSLFWGTVKSYFVVN